MGCVSQRAMGRIRRSASAVLVLLILLAETVDSGSGDVQDSTHACPMGAKRGLGRRGLCMVHPVVGNTGIARRGLCMNVPPPVQGHTLTPSHPHTLTPSHPHTLSPSHPHTQGWDLWHPSWGPSEEGLLNARNFPDVEESDPEEVLSSTPNPPWRQPRGKS